MICGYFQSKYIFFAWFWVVWCWNASENVSIVYGWGRRNSQLGTYLRHYLHDCLHSQRPSCPRKSFLSSQDVCMKWNFKFFLKVMDFSLISSVSWDRGLLPYNFYGFECIFSTSFKKQVIDEIVAALSQHIFKFLCFVFFFLNYRANSLHQ